MPDFTIDENAPILVEFTQGPGMQPVPLTRKKIPDITKMSKEALDDAMNTIHQMATRMTSTVDKLTKKPSQVEIAFGLKFVAEAGVVIAKAGAEGSLNIKLVWG